MKEALTQINSADKLDQLNDIKVSFLGKKGELTSVLKSMKDVAPEDRPMVGQLVNDARSAIEEKLDEMKISLSKKAREEQIKRETIDVTLPGEKPMIGHRHPDTIALRSGENLYRHGL